MQESNVYEGCEGANFERFSNSTVRPIEGAHVWLDDFSFPVIEDCFESTLKELGTAAHIALLDPRLQVEVVPVSSDGFPVYAFFPMHRHRWITSWIEVRPATRILPSPL
jgi:hypothetical protein